MHLQPHLAARAFHKVRRPVVRRPTEAPRAGRWACRLHRPAPRDPPRTHPRCLFSAEWRGDSRPRHALRIARAFPIHKHKQRGAFVIGRHVKKLYEFFLWRSHSRPPRIQPESVRVISGGIAENAFPGCMAQAVRTRGGCKR